MAISAVVLLNAVMGYVQQDAGRIRHRGAAADGGRARARDSRRRRAQRSGRRSRARRHPPRRRRRHVPADARVIQSTALQTAEAALTGESLPVSKDCAAIAGEVGLGDRDNMIYSGTAVTFGRGRAVVVATGMQTEMGRIAGMLRRRSERDRRRCRRSSIASASCSASSSSSSRSS